MMMKMRLIFVICNRFEVVKVPFPFTDNNATKMRPAVIISSAEFNRHVGKSIMAMVTSSTKTKWLYDTKITNIATTGLTISCCIRMKLFTIDNAFIIKKLGRLSDNDIDSFCTNFAALTQN